MENDKLEAVNRRLEKRLKTAKISSYIPPIPLSFHCAELPDDGYILRYMFPSNGKITKAFLFVGDTIGKNDDVSVSISVSSTNGLSSSMSYQIRKSFTPVEIDFSVSAGDRLRAGMESNKHISDIWIAFLWQPIISDAEVRRFLIDQLIERDSDEGI